ncbi:hypothetical protein Trydic_g8130 [Trypoxylus dichotomus]
MRRITATFTSRLINVKQKECRMDVCKELKERLHQTTIAPSSPPLKKDGQVRRWYYHKGKVKLKLPGEIINAEFYRNDLKRENMGRKHA